jgi:lysophospholipase L1-like esterase
MKNLPRTIVAAVRLVGVTLGLAVTVSVADQASVTPNPPASVDPRIVVAAAGDSTTAQRAADAHTCGWVQLLAKEFKPGVTVHNHARGGRSSRSFMNEGHWQKLLDQRPDFIFVQFGHNDSKSETNRFTDPQTSFKEFLRRYVDEGTAAGAKVILVTPMERRNFTEAGKIKPNNDGYAQATREVAAEKGVLVIDLYAHSVVALEKMGREASDALGSTPTDRTHWNAKGSQLWADFISAELRGVQDPRYAPLVQSLKPQP